MGGMRRLDVSLSLRGGGCTTLFTGGLTSYADPHLDLYLPAGITHDRHHGGGVVDGVVVDQRGARRGKAKVV